MTFCSRNGLPLPQASASTKNPALVVFRLGVGTWSEHLGQAGCFRLPVKLCRPQPRSASLSCPIYGPSAIVARHEQGRVNPDLHRAKNATLLAASPVPFSAMKAKKARNRELPESAKNQNCVLDLRASILGTQKGKHGKKHHKESNDTTAQAAARVASTRA